MLDKEFGKYICLSSLLIVLVGWLMPFLTIGTETNPIPALVCSLCGLIVWKVSIFNGEQSWNRSIGRTPG